MWMCLHYTHVYTIYEYVVSCVLLSIRNIFSWLSLFLSLSSQISSLSEHIFRCTQTTAEHIRRFRFFPSHHQLSICTHLFLLFILPTSSSSAYDALPVLWALLHLYVCLICVLEWKHKEGRPSRFTNTLKSTAVRNDVRMNILVCSFARQGQPQPFFRYHDMFTQIFCIDCERACVHLFKKNIWEMLAM